MTRTRTPTSMVSTHCVCIWKAVVFSASSNGLLPTILAILTILALCLPHLGFVLASAATRPPSRNIRPQPDNQRLEVAGRATSSGTPDVHTRYTWVSYQWVGNGTVCSMCYPCTMSEASTRTKCIQMLRVLCEILVVSRNLSGQN